MTAQDARERAWEMFRETYPNLTWSEFATAYDEGHADGRREDEQRIAALVAEFEMVCVRCQFDRYSHENQPIDGSWSIDHPFVEGNLYVRRALAGIEERSSAG